MIIQGTEADFAALDELINYANISNDEADFGQALELGLDLFSHAVEFKSDACQLLAPTYRLLNRSVAVRSRCAASARQGDHRGAGWSQSRRLITKGQVDTERQVITDGERAPKSTKSHKTASAEENCKAHPRPTHIAPSGLCLPILWKCRRNGADVLWILLRLLLSCQCCLLNSLTPQVLHLLDRARCATGGRLCYCQCAQTFNNGLFHNDFRILNKLPLEHQSTPFPFARNPCYFGLGLCMPDSATAHAAGTASVSPLTGTPHPISSPHHREMLAHIPSQRLPLLRGRHDVVVRLQVVMRSLKWLLLSCGGRQTSRRT